MGQARAGPYAGRADRLAGAPRSRPRTMLRTTCAARQDSAPVRVVPASVLVADPLWGPFGGCWERAWLASKERTTRGEMGRPFLAGVKAIRNGSVRCWAPRRGRANCEKLRHSGLAPT